MYELYDTGVTKVLEELKTNSYSPSTIYFHQQCYREFKIWLMENDRQYSFSAALTWLDEGKALWYHPKYKYFRQSLYQLDDMLAHKAFSKRYIYDNSPAYQRLPAWARTSVDEFVDKERVRLSNSSYVESIRCQCAHFMDYLSQKGVQSVDEISCHHIISYHAEGKHESRRSRNRYESTNRRFLEHLHRKEGIPLSLSFAMNILALSYIVMLEDIPEADRQIILHTVQVQENCMAVSEYLSKAYEITDTHLPAYQYSKTVIQNTRWAYRLLFIFLETNGFNYSAELSMIWLDLIKVALRKQWQSFRRALKLLNQYIASGDFNPNVTYSDKEDPVAGFPDWCRQPLESYLVLKAKEGLAPSSLAMQKSSCVRFIRYLLKENIDDFNGVTPYLIQGFHVEDLHKTAEGKNAYNVRIRMFLEYLEEADLVPFALSFSLPCVSAPHDRIVEILDDIQLNKIKEHQFNTDKPMDLRMTAMILLGLKMGLRASDIAKLKLTDISWQQCSITIIQKKTGVGLVLPMPVSVGNALYRYIRNGRPDIKNTHVFVHHRAPYRHLDSGCCMRALRNVLNEPRGGFHITRKTYASKLLRTGAKLSAIVDSLGHSDDNSVFKYLAMDEDNMRRCSISLEDAGITLIGGAKI